VSTGVTRSFLRAQGVPVQGAAATDAIPRAQLEQYARSFTLGIECRE
jgi:hypothetical protein